MRIKCLFLGHNWEAKKRFYSENGIYGIHQYKIVCSRCGKGNKKEWKEDKVIIIKSN